MQIISNVALISINETFLVQIISFLIFLFIINRILIRPLRGILQQRRNLVADIHQEMTDAQKDLEDSVRQIQHKEAAMLKAANDLRAKLEADGNREAQGIVAAARTEVETQRQKAEAEISALITDARKDVLAEAETVAAYIMEKILDRRLVS